MAVNKGKHADAKIHREIFRLLDMHLKPPQDGIVSYNEGWDDARVAAAAGNCSVNAVMRVRQHAYGKLFTMRRGAAETEQQLARIEEHLAALTSHHADLANRFHTLCETLSLNKVANVRHLGRANVNGDKH